MFYVDVIDTETASLEGGVCDLAIVRIDNDFNKVWEVESLIDPECPISPSASAIHHITDDMVRFEPTLAEFMELHSYPFKREALILSGHNVRFDLRMLASTLPKQYGKLCTLKLARNTWTNGEVENHQLQTLRYTFGLDAGNAHRAMGDVITCISLLKLLAEKHKTDLKGLVELAKTPLTLETPMPFGKHKGTKLKDVPQSYVRWALDNIADLDPDLREALASRQ